MLIKSEASRRNARPNILLSREVPDGERDEQDTPEALAHAERMGAIQALGQALVTKRQEAVDHRNNIGIQLDWQEDDDYYDARDRANPEGETNVGKPISPDGGSITSDQSNRRPQRSTVFVPITRPYVDAAHARVSDMLLPNDDAPWSIRPTPVQDEMAAIGGGMQPIAAAATGAAQMPGPGFEQQAADPNAPAPAMPLGVASTTKTEEELAAEEATKIIEDWMIECQWHAEVRKVIESAARIGTGVLKGPIPEYRTFSKVERDPITGATMIVRGRKMVPVSRCVRAQNCYPDPAAGDDIQKGSFHFEYDQIGERSIRNLLDDETYIREALISVLREGPNKAYADDNGSPEDQEAVRLGSMYPVWYFYGDVTRKDLEAAGVPAEEFSDEQDDESFSIPALITMFNDTVVKAAINPVENGGFPYDYFPWQRRSGMPWGRGVARQVRTPQRMLNAAVRSMMDNAGLTSGPLFGIRKEWIEPLTGSWNLTPRMGFAMTAKAPPTAKIQDALTFVNVQSNINELDLLVMKALKFAEDATGLPMLMQGQQGSAPDTVGGMTILNNNGSTVLRRLARNFDDFVTERHIRRYYEYLLNDPQVPDRVKRDFQIDARGSTALVERDLQNQALNQLTPLLLQSPRVDKDKLAEQLLKANRLDPKSILYDDAAYERIKQQPPPPPLPLLVQQERNKGAQELAAAKLDHEDRMRSADREQEHEQWLGELAAKLQISTDTLKKGLTETSAKLNTQVMLSNTQRAHEMLKPPTEPSGRAPDGKSFQR